MNKTQKGFAALEAILIIVILVIIGGTGYYVWHSKQQTDKTLSQAEKTSQITPRITAKKASNTSTSTSSSKSASYVNLTEWGIKIKIRDADKVVFTIDDSVTKPYGIDAIGTAGPKFKPEALVDKSCEPGVSLYRSNQSPGDFANKKVNEKYYWITGGPGACSNNPTTNPDDILKQRFLQDFIVDNIEQI